MFVVVYLRDAQCSTVIPEEFILDLNQKTLKNNGINRNQNRRIFFSKEWFENQEKKINLDQQFEPNFDLPISNEYPLADNVAEACFIGRLIKFEGTYKYSMNYLQCVYA